MGIKDQLVKLKDNWLLIVLFLIVLLFVSGGNLIGSFKSVSFDEALMAPGMGYEARSMASSYYGGQADFAPEVEDRVITKTASLSTEVERGTFTSAEMQLKDIVTSSESFVLNQNVRKYGTKRKAYFTGSYQLKVDTRKYESVVSQLKQIGEVQSFNENQLDETGRYTDLQVDLEAEKARLERYQEIYSAASNAQEKLDITDRIFEQERRIKWIEESIDNIDKRVDYSTVYFTLNEKRSEYADVVWVKLSELVQAFVSSINTLVKLVFVLAPWALAVLFVWIVWKLVRRMRPV